MPFLANFQSSMLEVAYFWNGRPRLFAVIQLKIINR